MSAEQANPMRFKGVASDGVFKGKVIEGKLDIKVNVESVTDKPKDPPKPAPFTWEVFLFVLIVSLVANHASGDPAGMRNYSKMQQQSSHHQVLR
ncbi:hypothetical protein [Microcoleus sp. OTE_8_concoct_300]|uniref:hypothetical protein n=1 Tax=Microcoleus sp. OTE_8_concoct_300 TaxID=2964710 RepID=UPI00403FBF14